jgi:hypothetical protein
MGGGIFNEGTLTLTGVTLSGNHAQGGNGGAASAFASTAVSGGGGGGVGGPGTDGQGSAFGSANGGNGGPPNGGLGGAPSQGGANGASGGGGGGGGTDGGSGGSGGFGGGGGGGGGDLASSSLGQIPIGSNGGSGGFGGGGGGTGLGASSTGEVVSGGPGPGGFGGGNGALSGGGGAGFGGALFNLDGTVTITDSTLADNVAQGGAGGAASSSASGGNGLGGALFNLDGSVSLTNSTLADNIVGGATPAGGALYSLQQSGTATLNLTNTILADSSGGSDAVNNDGVVNGGHNLVMTSTGLPAAAIVSTADPLLGPLMNNGGPTPTMALLPGSPAIDTGDSSVTGAPLNLTTDQRGPGFARLAGAAVDIGAFEARPFHVSVVSGSPQSVPINTNFANPLEAEVDEGGNPLAGATVTFTAPSSGAGGTFAAGVTSVTVTTDASGIATAPLFTANGTPGSYAVTATVAGGVTSPSFALTNTNTQPPVANPDTYQTYENTELVTTAFNGVLANDTQAEGDPLTALSGTFTLMGGGLLLNSDGSFIYQPPRGFLGYDTFQYQAKDTVTGLLSLVETVAINVVPIPAPVARNAFYHVNPNGQLAVPDPGLLDYVTGPGPLSLPHAGLANDNTPSIEFVGNPNGSLIYDVGGGFTYTPNPGFTGLETLTYRALGLGGYSNWAVLLIAVSPPPVANNEQYSVNENGVLTEDAPGVLANNGGIGPLTAVVQQGTVNGQLTLNPTNGSFTYAPNAGFVGQDSFTYVAQETLTDPYGNQVTVPSTVGTVTITVNPPATATTLTSDHSSGSVYGQTVSLTATVTTGGSPVTAGTVTFEDGNTALGPAVSLNTSGQASFATSLLSAATHTITAAYSGSGIFAASSATASQAVTPAALTVTGNALMKVYGSADPMLTYVANGFQSSDTAATVLTGSLARAPGESVTGGPYPITQGTLAANTNYTIAFTGSNLTITPAPLVVTANSQTKVYGDPLPALTGTLTGVVNNDGITASFTTPATQTSDVVSGGYPITPGLNDPNNRLSNYTVTSNNGILTITPANQTIIWSSPAPIVVGIPLSSTQLDATVSVVGPAPAGSLTYTPPAGTVLGPGSGEILSVTAAATLDYLAAAATGSISVGYNFGGFLPPLNNGLAFATGRTVPIKFQLIDALGNCISSLGAFTALQVSYPDGTSHAITGLRYDSTANQYVANWSTKGLAAGSYTIQLSLIDGTTHTVPVTIVLSHSSAGLTTGAAGGTGSAPGGLLGGNIDLFVDNSNGDLTTDELARIQDAVTAVDAVTEPYGVAVAEVTDPTQADVTLNMDTTSAVGGYADGVLGCTTDAGQITIIAGWNFYAGSDAAQIGAAQYDFQTVVTHELGHALGLGHSTDSTSVMYATLNTGTVNGGLTTADLNVPDSDTTGACGLHAVLPPGALTNGTSPRDLLFALLAAELPHGNVAASLTGGLPGPTVARDAAFSAIMAEWPPTQDAALPGGGSSPFFAAQSPREGDGPLFPLFREPSQDAPADAWSAYGQWGPAKLAQQS